MLAYSCSSYQVRPADLVSFGDCHTHSLLKENSESTQKKKKNLQMFLEHTLHEMMKKGLTG